MILKHVSLDYFMVVVGKHFAFLLIVVSWEIPTQLLTFKLLLPFQRQPRLPLAWNSAHLFIEPAKDQRDNLLGLRLGLQCERCIRNWFSRPRGAEFLSVHFVFNRTGVYRSGARGAGFLSQSF